MNQQPPIQQVPPQIPKTSLSNRKVWLIGGISLAVVLIISAAIVWFVVSGSKNNQAATGRTDTSNSSEVSRQKISQTDSQRKLDVARVLVALNDYMANHRGILPTPDVIKSSDFASKSGSSYLDTSDIKSNIVVDQSEDTVDNLNIHLGVDCKGVSGQRNASVSIQLQDTGKTYCDSI